MAAAVASPPLTPMIWSSLPVHDNGRHPDLAEGGGPVAGGQDGRELPAGPLGVVGAVEAAGGSAPHRLLVERDRPCRS